ncbi:hypothetical protein [Streptomyces cyaneofuscatus]|uniref:hypothetical protein n=1 Tax=Streptomyces cyaneofuscatus TaxID=66883 RepID=UPI0036668361
MRNQITQTAKESCRGRAVVGVRELGVDTPVIGCVQVDPMVSPKPVGRVVAAELESAQIDEDLQRVHVEGSPRRTEVSAVIDVQALQVLDLRTHPAGL